MSVNIAICLPFGIGIALIVQLLTAAEADLDLEARAFEVNREGDEGKALLTDQPREFHDLSFMHEQAAVAQWLAVENISVLVRTDMDADSIDLTLFNMAV